MADKKITELPGGSEIEETDLFALVQHLDATPDTYKSSALEVGTFVMGNATLVTNLANNTTFVTALAENDTFVTELISNETFITELTQNTTFIDNIVVEVNADDVWVNTDGDTMTGDLEFLHPSATYGFVIQPISDGNTNLSQVNLNNDLYLGVSTADQTLGATGSIIAGRFRCSIPLVDHGASVVLTSTVDASALISYFNGSAGDLVIRKNDGTAGEDFFTGNYFSVVQTGAGQATLVPETANVHLLIPDGFIAATRAQYSTISATLLSADVSPGPVHNDEYWLISGDLAEAP